MCQHNNDDITIIRNKFLGYKYYYRLDLRGYEVVVDMANPAISPSRGKKIY